MTLMKISELQINQGKVEIEANVTEKSDAREFEKFGKKGRVCDVMIKDDSGEIKLTLWNEQVDSVNVGNKVKISNGYVSEFRGEKRLSTGKFGKLEVLDTTSEDHGEHILTEDEKQEAESLNEDMENPDIEEEVTEDELEESDLVSKKPAKVEDADDGIDVEEEKID